MVIRTRKPYDPETRAWIDAADTPKERERRKQRAKYLRHKERYKARARERYADPEQREQILARNDDWQARNADKVAADKLAWERQDKLKHPEKYREKRRKHKEENRPQYRARDARRRTAKKNCTPPWVNHKKIEFVYQLAAWASKFTDEPLEVDHIVPIMHDSVCGLHVPANLQVIPQSENRAKSNKFGPGVPQSWLW